MVTAAVALAFGALALGLPSSSPSAARALVVYEAEVNLLILGFNLVPAFPLDGGRVARALLWRRTGDIGRATEIAAAVGRGFGYLLVGGGLFLWFSGVPGGLWFALIGLFVIAAANAERIQEQAVAMLTGVSAGEVMSHPAVTLPASLTLSDAISHFIRYRFTAFPVTDAAGRTLGLLSIDAINRLPRSKWAATRVEEVVDRDRALRVGEHEDVAHLLDRSAVQRVGRAVVVDDVGRPVGIVSVTDIERVLRATRIGGRPGAPRRLAPHG
jgi:CBS domain-containing protein